MLNISTEYQILCPKTAFIGVIKLKNKAQEEAEKIVMPTISSVVPHVPNYPIYGGMNYGGMKQNLVMNMVSGARCAAPSGGVFKKKSKGMH